MHFTPSTVATLVRSASTSDFTGLSLTVPLVGDQTTFAEFVLAFLGETSMRKLCARADWVLGSENESLNVPLNVVARNPTATMATTHTRIATSGRRIAHVDTRPTVDLLVGGPLLEPAVTVPPQATLLVCSR